MKKSDGYKKMRYIRTLNGIRGCAFTENNCPGPTFMFEGKTDRDLTLSVYKAMPMIPGKEVCTLDMFFVTVQGKTTFYRKERTF